MGVNYRYPGTLLIGAVIIAIVCLAAFLLRRRHKERMSLRVANTNRLKKHPLYKRKLLEARVFRILTAAGIILALAGSLFLTARPYRKDSLKDPVTRRDIFLCIDLSASNYDGVQKLVEEFRETIRRLDGDRIGISVFNTSSVRYVPMTDDYVFALERLESLAGYLAAEEEFMINYVQQYDSVYDIPESERPRYEELNRILSSVDEGITAGYELKGTSAVGEGLASCLFSFPELTEEKRTRVIFFLTDNHEELIDEPLVTLEESAKMCASDEVTVFGIYPRKINSGQQSDAGQDGKLSQNADFKHDKKNGQNKNVGQNADFKQSCDSVKSKNMSESAPFGQDDESASEMNAMKAAVEMTGGKFYTADSTVNADVILQDIHSLETRDTNTATAALDQDMPAFWFGILLAGFAIIAATTLFFILRRGIRRGQFSRKLTAAVLLGATAVSIIVIAARPMYLSPDTEIMTSNLDVAFVVDTTISMWAEDQETPGQNLPDVKIPGSDSSDPESTVIETRMDGVKKDIYSIITALPGSSFSLIRFDNGAEIMTPFTQDIDAVCDMVDGLDMPAYATAKGSSLNTAYEALKAILESAGRKDASRRTIVFVFSDGESTDGSELMSFSDLSGMIDEGAVLGYGTKEGGEMYYPDRGYIKNSSTGQKALSCIDEDSLRSIADDLGLVYINETDDASSSVTLNGSHLGGELRSIRMMSRDAAFADGDRTGYKETYYYFAAFSGLMLLIWLFLTIYRGGVAC